MKRTVKKQQNSVDTAAPEGTDQYPGAASGDTLGYAAIVGVSPEFERQFGVILNHRLQLTGVLSPDGRLLAANKLALAFAEGSESEVLGRWFWDCPWWMHSEQDRNRLKASVGKAADGFDVRYETTHQDKGGKIRNIDFSLRPVFDGNGDVTYLVPEGLDITEAKKREASLRESEERHRILIETARDAIFMMNWNMFVECNQKTLDILQYKRKDIIGHSILDFSPPEQPGQVDSKKVMMEKIKTALQGRPQRFSWIHTKCDGTSFEAELSFDRIDLSTGPHILGRLRDVTERNRLEKERKGLQERLQQAQKMEAIGTLAAGIAHDFNNILAPVIGYAELTMNQVEKSSPVHEYQQNILMTALRAKDLIQLILAFSRKGDMVIKPLKVKIILKETLKLVRASFPSNIDIVETIDSEGVVLSSPTHIQQVVMNLCTNANHAMKETGGSLRVSLVEEDLCEQFSNHYSDLSPGRYLKLTVADTGHGIAPEIRQLIFDPYFTTKKKEEGTGLGLSMVHGIVKDCGGEILIDSEPGKGTVFNVYLPVAPKTQEEEKSLPLATPVGSEKILVVDDEKPILEMYTGFLERLGYCVTARISSVEALAAFKGNPDAYDLVLTDMMMPDMTGEKLAKEISECRSDIPIILCTGYSNRVVEKTAKAMGVDALLMKPVVLSDLAVTIRQLIDDDPEAQRRVSEQHDLKVCNEINI